MERRKKTASNKRLGSWGEHTARLYLEGQGVQVLMTNVRTAYGEIDLIGRDEGDLVFFEVKTRRTHTFGYPEQSVNPKKQEHMLNSALDYLQSSQQMDTPWRIDVVAIEKEANKEIKVTWFKHALSG
jgi:putative endonuclease